MTKDKLVRKNFECGECDPEVPCKSSAEVYEWDDSPPTECLFGSADPNWKLKK